MAHASAVNAIPKMTSNVLPNGEASASSTFSSAPAWMAFDKNTNTATNAWVSGATTTGWVQYKFTQKILIAKYVIYPQVNSLTRAPRSWTLEGSDDGSTWETLDSRVDIAGWVNNVGKEFTIQTPKLKQYYRLNITANSGDASYLSLNELEMYELLYDHKLLFVNEGKLKSVIKPYLSNNLIPIMTSNTAPSGVASASSESASNYAAYYAFNGLKGTGNSWQSTTVQCWISYAFTEKKIVNAYALTSDTASRAGYMPKRWNFEGSNDGLNWEILDTRVDQTGWLEAETKTYAINNKKDFLSYRLNILDSNNNARVFLSELEMFYYSLGEIIELDKLDANEKDFLTHGANKFDEVIVIYDKNKKISTLHSSLGSGTAFEHLIDTSKRKINKIIF